MQNIVLRGVFVAINSLIFLGTIILNLLAIVYILSTRDKTTIAILVVNLAIADIIHAMGIIFFSSNLFTRSWIFGEFGCKFSLTIDVLCTVVIVYTVAALSVERYIDARSTLTAKFRTVITLSSLILIWTLGLLLPFPFMIYTYLTDINNPNGNINNNKNLTVMLSCQSHLSEQTLFIHEIILYIIAFLIPYSIIVLFSLKLLHFLRDWLKRKEKLTRTSITRKRTRGVKLVLCIVLSFLMCYTPFWAFKFYTRYMVDENVVRRPVLQRILQYIHLLVVLLNHFEGVLNPLFFIVLTERFCITFSKHRQRHSRLFGTTSSVVLLTRGRKATVTSSQATIQTRNTEFNGLLPLKNTNTTTNNNNHHHQIENNDQIPIVAEDL